MIYMLLKKTKYYIPDITTYFISECCSSKKEPNPCEKAPPKNGYVLKFSKRVKKILQREVNYDAISKVHLHLSNLHADGIDMVKTTITIGVRDVGKLHYKQQYLKMIDLIKKYHKYQNKCGNDVKYIYHFELTQSGQLHAHGLEYNTTRINFEHIMGTIGSRNRHPSAYIEVKRFVGIKEYLNYINKENILAPITNIQYEPTERTRGNDTRHSQLGCDDECRIPPVSEEAESL